LLGLEHEGLIERNPGKGSFVRRVEKPIAELKMTCLLEDLIALGIPARNVVRESAVASASASIAEALQIKPGADIFTFLRLVMVESEPFAAQRTFLPGWMGQRLTDKDLAHPHLLRTLEARCHIRANSANQLIEAIHADANCANLLDVRAGTALLSVTRTSYDHEQKPMEHSTTLYRSDRTRFFVSQRHRRSEDSDWVLAERGPRGAPAARAIGRAKKTGPRERVRGRLSK
ncbi:MAG: GntR family transcriptional regulator, partial [Proteobacteria bacterium]|nr:GntR family transcriptional regulator [Pseudomonadota bacterium]